ncbi:hypothetical protein C474_07047 [Halogeometricum pallidum JCM 14848]|uniref:Uncharacterized protein n=1 Tax=Halogeometricum pallidum JCM 14848 TaxID=1227487 RepID=M0DCW2_HALPD|nr:hypothetical protein C474_07047 [Halogeometricum pallidum JCM 14848]
MNFTRELVVDDASEVVRIDSPCPGFVETPMTDD